MLFACRSLALQRPVRSGATIIAGAAAWRHDSRPRAPWCALRGTAQVRQALHRESGTEDDRAERQHRCDPPPPSQRQRSDGRLGRPAAEAGAMREFDACTDTPADRTLHLRQQHRRRAAQFRISSRRGRRTTVVRRAQTVPGRVPRTEADQPTQHPSMRAIDAPVGERAYRRCTPAVGRAVPMVLPRAGAAKARAGDAAGPSDAICSCLRRQSGGFEDGHGGGIRAHGVEFPILFEQNLCHSLMWVISIGTNEIQRSLIARRGLGLPR